MTSNSTIRHYRRMTAILFVLLLVSFAFNVYYNATDKETVRVETRTDTVTLTETIHDTVPKLVTETHIRTVRDTFPIERIIHDTVQNNAVVSLPISQRTYSDDSTYTAWVSGYKPELDSIHVQQRTRIITRETTITRKDNRKFSIGPSIHFGYNPHNRACEYGIGISLTYNIVKW